MNHMEFIGMIKLVSGEEIIGNIVVCDQENGFVIETPFAVDETIIETPTGELVKLDLRPWAKFSKEEIFFIDKEKTITVYEADERIYRIYSKTVRKYLNQEEDVNRVNLSEEMGFKTKITDARKSLENIFRRS